MYNLGARRFAVTDVPPVGCCPYPRSLNPTGGCIDILNELALGFNKAVQVLMQNLSSSLAGMKYSIGSSYEVVSNIIKNPHALGKHMEEICYFISCRHSSAAYVLLCLNHVVRQLLGLCRGKN